MFPWKLWPTVSLDNCRQCMQNMAAGCADWTYTKRRPKSFPFQKICGWDKAACPQIPYNTTVIWKRTAHCPHKSSSSRQRHPAQQKRPSNRLLQNPLQQKFKIASTHGFAFLEESCFYCCVPMHWYLHWHTADFIRRAKRFTVICFKPIV